MASMDFCRIVGVPDHPEGPMPNTTSPQLQLSLEFAERLVRHLREAGGKIGAASLLHDAEQLRAEIDAQFSQAPPEH